jgi:predicted metal-binding membrane protein
MTGWTAMMAAMMLPGAAPAALRLGRVAAVPVFAASYFAVWALVGFAASTVYQPHGAILAGSLTVAAGLYELTSLKRACRNRCRERVRSGVEFGVYCVGSSVGLMVVLLAVDPMSLVWMCAVCGLVLMQKLTPPRAFVDVPIALAIVALGIVIAG